MASTVLDSLNIDHPRLVYRPRPRHAPQHFSTPRSPLVRAGDVPCASHSSLSNSSRYAANPAGNLA